MFKIGDEVAYSKRFLRCIMTPATDPVWFLRGRITSVDDRIAYVHWDGEDTPVAVGVCNLAKPGPNLAFCD